MINVGESSPKRTLSTLFSDQKDSDLDTTELAKQARQGNQEAFLTLYNLYLNRVYSRVRSKIPSQDVEDVVQDVFIAVVWSLDSFELRSEFGTWLYTIVNRQIADFYRKRARKANPDGPPLSLDDADRARRIRPDAGSLGDGLDERLVIQNALNHLPAHYQEIILLRFADKITFSEIAAQRGQTLEAVKSLYRRALQAIRDQVDGSE